MEGSFKICNQCKKIIDSKFNNYLTCDQCKFQHNFHLECFHQCRLQNSDFPEKCFQCNHKLFSWFQTTKGMKTMLAIFFYFYLIGLPLAFATFYYPEQVNKLVNLDSWFIVNYLLLMKFWFDGFLIQNYAIVSIEILIVVYSLIYTFLS